MGFFFSLTGQLFFCFIFVSVIMLLKEDCKVVTLSYLPALKATYYSVVLCAAPDHPDGMCLVCVWFGHAWPGFRGGTLRGGHALRGGALWEIGSRVVPGIAPHMFLCQLQFTFFLFFLYVPPFSFLFSLSSLPSLLTRYAGCMILVCVPNGSNGHDQFDFPQCETVSCFW